MPDDKPVGREQVANDSIPIVFRHTGYDKLAMFFEHAILHKKAAGDAVLFDNAVDLACIWNDPSSTELTDVDASSASSLRKVNDEDADVLKVEYMRDVMRAAFCTVVRQSKVTGNNVDLKFASIDDIGTSTAQILAIFAYYVRMVLIDEGLRNFINSVTLSSDLAELFEYFDWKAGGTGAWNVTGAHHWKYVLRNMLMMAAREPRIEGWSNYENQEQIVVNRHAYDCVCKYARILMDKEMAPIFQTGKMMYIIAALDPKKIPGNKLDIQAFKGAIDEKWKWIGVDHLPSEDVPSGYTQLNGYYINDSFIKAETLNKYLDQYAHQYETHQEVIDDARECYGLCLWEFNGEKVLVAIGKTFCSKSMNTTTNAVSDLKATVAGSVTTIKNGYNHWFLGIDEKLAIDYFEYSHKWAPAWKAMFKYRKHRSFAVIPDSFKNQFDVKFEFYKTFNGYCDAEAPFPYFYDVSYEGNLGAESKYLPDPEEEFGDALTYRNGHDALKTLDINPTSFFLTCLHKQAPDQTQILFFSKGAATPKALGARAKFWLKHMREQVDTGSADYERTWLTKRIYVDLVDAITKDPVCLMGIDTDVLRYENIKQYYATTGLWQKYGHQIFKLSATIGDANLIIQDSRPHGIEGKEAVRFIKIKEKITANHPFIISLFTFADVKEEKKEKATPTPPPAEAPKADANAPPLQEGSTKNNEDDDGAG